MSTPAISDIDSDGLIFFFLIDIRTYNLKISVIRIDNISLKLKPIAHIN